MLGIPAVTNVGAFASPVLAQRPPFENPHRFGWHKAVRQYATFLVRKGLILIFLVDDFVL